MCVCICKTFPDTGGQNRSPEWSDNGPCPRAAWWKRTRVLIHGSSRMAGFAFLLIRAGPGCRVRNELRDLESRQGCQPSGGYRESSVLKGAAEDGTEDPSEL